jgi:hypothetical protein
MEATDFEVIRGMAIPHFDFVEINISPGDANQQALNGGAWQSNRRLYLNISVGFV